MRSLSVHFDIIHLSISSKCEITSQQALVLDYMLTNNILCLVISSWNFIFLTFVSRSTSFQKIILLNSKLLLVYSQSCFILMKYTNLSESTVWFSCNQNPLQHIIKIKLTYLEDN